MTTFTIGGEAIDVPPLNLKAQRLAMRLLPDAFAANDPDKTIGAFLEIVSIRLASTATPMTVDELETKIEGKTELEGFGVSMRQLLADSGFTAAATAGEADPVVMEGASPEIQTPSSTGSSAP